MLILTTFDLDESASFRAAGPGAAKLFVSMSTVKAHIGKLLAKLGARDRAQLVIAAYSARLVGDR